MIYQATHFEDVRQHVHECAECAAALDELAARQ